MKRKNAALCGNALMACGMAVMVLGVGSAVVSQLPDLHLPSLFAQGSVFGIFIGAVLWLAGARIGGREQVCDRYWWHRNFDKRCRRNSH